MDDVSKDQATSLLIDVGNFYHKKKKVMKFILLALIMILACTLVTAVAIAILYRHGMQCNGSGW